MTHTRTHADEEVQQLKQSANQAIALLNKIIPEELFANGYLSKIEGTQVTMRNSLDDIFIRGIKNSALATALISTLNLSQYRPMSHAALGKNFFGTSYFIRLSSLRAEQLLNQLIVLGSDNKITDQIRKAFITKSQARLKTLITHYQNCDLSEELKGKLRLLSYRTEPLNDLKDVLEVNEKLVELSMAYKAELDQKKSLAESSSQITMKHS